MKKRVISMLLALAGTAGLFAGCGNNQNSSALEETTAGTENGTNLSKEVNLVLYLYGSQGVANKDVLEQLNQILKEDINATLEVKYIDWGDVATKYPLLRTSGESFDLAYISSGAAVPYTTLAKQDALADITDMLDTCAPTLKAAIDQEAWDSVNVDGKIYGVPSTYSEFTAHGFVTRTDLMEKYEITSIQSIQDMEAYMDAAVADGRIPLNGSSNLAMDMYRMMIDITSDWINAPGLRNSEPYLLGKVSNPSGIFHPAFTDEYEAFAVKMREWSDKGYWSKDVLSASQDDKDNFHNDLSASYISHQPDWTGSYGTVEEKLGGVGTEFYCFTEENNKIIRKMGVENATAINANSKNQERALMLIEKLMTDEECYRLFQYGIEGREYEIVDGKVAKPSGYDTESDGAGFSGWAFRTDAFNVPNTTEDDRRYTLNEEWKKEAIDNPYVGFTFDTTAVSSEISAVANVNSQLGIQILLGKTQQEPKEAVAEYRKQLEAAGIEKIIKEVKLQYTEYLSSK